MMPVFLKHVSDSYPEHCILMLVDGAGWHVSKKLKVPENIKLIKQPAHSPELNPVEHVREEIREKHFHNKAMLSMRVLDNLSSGKMENLAPFMDSIDFILLWKFQQASENRRPMKDGFTISEFPLTIGAEFLYTSGNSA